MLLLLLMLLAVVAAVVVVEVAMAVEVAAVAVLAVVDDATAFEGSQHTDSFLPLSTSSCPLPLHRTLPTYPPTCIPTQPTLAMMLSCSTGGNLLQLKNR